MKLLAVLLVVCAVSGVQLAAIQSGCPGGLGVVNCFVDPCSTQLQCHGYPDATCKSNYCGGCNAFWYNPDGSEVVCH